jgi:kynureninase
MMTFQHSPAFADLLDSQDPLARYRGRFHIPKQPDGSEVVYLCSNSLGLQPRSTRAYIEQELQDWQTLGVEAHFRARAPWVSYHELLSEQLGRLVGAMPAEVVAMNSLTINLHLMMISFYRPSVDRYRIVIESNAFPSDQYAVKSQIRFHGFDPAKALVELKPPGGQAWLRVEDIEEFIEREGASIALILLGGVNYYSGQALDLRRVANCARRHGCIIGYDLAHAAGNIILRLHDWDVDFAVWCTYKYLCAGPGSTAGCFVHQRHAREPTLPRLAGWWGSNKHSRFQMGPDFEPIEGAEGWQVSNPAILPLAALRASMEIFDEIGMDRLRAKSELLTGYLEFLLNEHVDRAWSVLTPRDPQQRGAQLSLRIVRDGKRVFEKLTGEGVMCDWREPGVIRIAPAPLYNSFRDVHRFAEILTKAVNES